MPGKSVPPQTTRPEAQAQKDEDRQTALVSSFTLAGTGMEPEREKNEYFRGGQSFSCCDGAGLRWPVRREA